MSFVFYRIQGSYLGENVEEYERLERHLEKNHFEISDLETRRAFSLLVLAQETKMVVTITGLKQAQSIVQAAQ